MNKLYLLIAIFIFAPILSYSQSKIEIDKDRNLYKSNNVKNEIIEYSDGSNIITKFDKNGSPSEIVYYDNNNKAIRLVSCKYDNIGNKTEDSYIGYESGDRWSVFFYYDKYGNTIMTKTVGSDDNEQYYKYDEHGYLTQTKYVDIGVSDPPYYIEYNNVYENGKLVTKEILCNQQTPDIIQTKYTYSGDNIILIEEFEKNCSTNLVKYYSKKSIDYFENNLVKETTFESVYIEGLQKAVYSYEFYTN